jgi:hypothetical protein
MGRHINLCVDIKVLWFCVEGSAVHSHPIPCIHGIVSFKSQNCYLISMTQLTVLYNIVECGYIF